MSCSIKFCCSRWKNIKKKENVVKIMEIEFCASEAENEVHSTEVLNRNAE